MSTSASIPWTSAGSHSDPKFVRWTSCEATKPQLLHADQSSLEELLFRASGECKHKVQNEHRDEATPCSQLSTSLQNTILHPTNLVHSLRYVAIVAIPTPNKNLSNDNIQSNYVLSFSIQMQTAGNAKKLGYHATPWCRRFF